MRRPFLALGLIALAAGLLLFLFGLSVVGTKDEEKNAANELTQTVTPLEQPTVVFGNPTRGPNDAKVTIVEFGDFECGPCAELEPVLAEILKNHPRDVRLVWKDFPNESLHPNSLVAAQAARCAGAQGRYWEFHDLLLANQGAISTPNMGEFAKQLNLNADDFKICLDSGAMKPIVERDFEEGVRLRIDGTPYLFINERRVSGALSGAQLEAIIEQILPVVKK